MPCTIDNYTCVKTLGAGISAKVKLARDNSSGQLVALKIFSKNNPQNTAQSLKVLQDEVSSYMQLNHKNIVNFISFKEDAVLNHGNKPAEKVAYMALEWVNGGEFFDYVALKSFDEHVCRAFFKKMLQAMHHAHSRGLSHRDLKPENMLLSDKFDVKIADFGFAAPLQGRDGSGYLHT
jgi:serine/threonine protein kinase